MSLLDLLQMRAHARVTNGTPMDNQPATLAANAALSGWLVSTPFWVDFMHVFSAAMSLISVTTGAAIGVLTLYRWLSTGTKPKE